MKNLRNKLAAGLAIAAMALAATAGAQTKPLAVQKISAAEAEACGLHVSEISMNHINDQMIIEMSLELENYVMKGDRASIFTPVLSNGSDSVTLTPVGVYSRLRYLQYLRDGEEPIGGPDEYSFKYKERETVMIANSFDYSEWMNGASLSIDRKDYGCCNTVLDECSSPLTDWKEIIYTPQFCYVDVATDAVKTRELAGRAYIDFPVNRTEIYPEYRKNPIELAKIIATIDSVRQDADVTVQAITIKGYASPESPWDNNTRLAKGRTATLKQYVQNMYHFEPDFIQTDYEPEDWAGLRAYVETSGLEHRAEILALIDDTTIEPDPKELKLKTTYPQEYAFLLQTVYPGLRHSDYTIQYTIRTFTDIDEIARIFHTAPNKLSINEMIKYANSLEPGSDLYNNVYETAARLYPSSDVANLNAANSAMQRGDMLSAERYLDKAGDSHQAIYARGVYAALSGDYDAALKLFTQAAGTVEQAAQAAATINEINNNIK